MSRKAVVAIFKVGVGERPSCAPWINFALSRDTGENVVSEKARESR